MAGPINPVRVRFDAPTHFEGPEEVPIPPQGILRYEYGFSQNAAGPFTGNIVADSDFTPDSDGKQTHNLNLTGFAFGQWYVAGRAISRDNQASSWTAAVPFEVRPRTPKPPENFTVA